MSGNSRMKTSVSKTGSDKSIAIRNGDGVRVSNKLTEKEVTARKIKKYATTTFGFNSKTAAGSGYSSGGSMDSQFGNFYSPQLSTDFLEKPQNLRERRAWYRHFYHSNEFVGQAIDLHSTLPLSKIRLEKPQGQNQEQIDYMYSYFVEMCDEVKLFKTLIEISHEFWMLGNCARGDTLIRTPGGFKTIDKVCVGDYVLTHKGRWKRVSAVCNREPEEDLIHIDIWKSFLPLVVTGEHPVEVLRNGVVSFVLAGEVDRKDYVRVTWPKNIIDIDYIDISNFSQIEKTADGYNRRVIISRKKQEIALAARKKFVAWITSLKNPVVKSRADIEKDLGIAHSTLNNLITQLHCEIGTGFHTRTGPKGYQKGSQVVWNPVPKGTISLEDVYSVSRINKHTSPHKIAIDNDFAYLVGYWVGDGTIGTDHKRIEWGRGLWQICGAGKSDESMQRVEKILLSVFGRENIKKWVSKGVTYIKVKGNPAFIEWWSDNFGRSYKSAKHKKIPQWFCDLPIEKLKNFLAGVVDSDGCSSKVKDCSVLLMGMTSRNLMDSIREISLKCGVVFSYRHTKDVSTILPGTGKPFVIKDWYTLTTMEEMSCRILTEFSCKKIKDNCRFTKTEPYYKRIHDDIFFKVKGISTDPAETVYNLEVEDDHTYQANGFSTHNCFIFAEDHEPYAIDNDEGETKANGMKETGRAEAERLYKEFKVVDRDPNYKGWRKLIILPPDQIRIKKIPLSDESLIEFIPDPETRKSILNDSDPNYFNTNEADTRKKTPQVPGSLIEQLKQNGSISMDTDPYSGSHVFHLARKKSQYETQGVSILERCVNTLLYDDKLRQAQTSIASRHMTPMRVVWAEELSDVDVENLREQVDMALTDPDFSIICNYEVHWEEMGSNGRLLQLDSEHEYIANCLFAGLGVTRELLTGEGTYAGNRITLEILNTQYLLFRELLQEYVENNLFKPVAKKKGFIEKDKYGREKLLYPKLSFTRLAIKDNDAFFEQAMQLYNKGSISIDIILEMLNIDPISTKKKIEADLFTVNDFAFNQLMANTYVAAGTKLVEGYSVADRLAEYLKLDPLPPPPAGAEGGDAGGLGAPPPPMGRFSSTGLSGKHKAALEKIIKLAMASPEKMDRIAEFLAKK
jgi:intein/homing endonuclease